MLDKDNQIAQNLYEMRIHGKREFPFVIYKKHFEENKLKYISLHWHPEVEIAYVESGKMEYTVNEKKYTLSAGEAMLVNRLELHGATMLEKCSWYAILFDPKLIYLFDESSIKHKFFENIPFHNIILSQENVNMLKELISLDSSAISYELKVLNILTNIYIDIFDNLNIDSISISSKTTNLRVKKILDFISQNYNQRIKIEDISKELGLCRSEVCKLFKDNLNTTFTEYLTKIRIEKAIDLLESKEANVSQISELVGFNSSSYFTETFKKYFNVTPLEYRKNLKK